MPETIYEQLQAPKKLVLETKPVSEPFFTPDERAYYAGQWMQLLFIEEEDHLIEQLNELHLQAPLSTIIPQLVSLTKQALNQEVITSTTLSSKVEHHLYHAYELPVFAFGLMLSSVLGPLDEDLTSLIREVDELHPLLAYGWSKHESMEDLLTRYHHASTSLQAQLAPYIFVFDPLKQQRFFTAAKHPISPILAQSILQNPSMQSFYEELPFQESLYDALASYLCAYPFAQTPFPDYAIALLYQMIDFSSIYLSKAEHVLALYQTMVALHQVNIDEDEQALLTQQIEALFLQNSYMDQLLHESILVYPLPLVCACTTYINQLRGSLQLPPSDLLRHAFTTHCLFVVEYALLDHRDYYGSAFALQLHNDLAANNIDRLEDEECRAWVIITNTLHQQKQLHAAMLHPLLHSSQPILQLGALDLLAAGALPKEEALQLLEGVQLDELSSAAKTHYAYAQLACRHSYALAPFPVDCHEDQALEHFLRSTSIHYKNRYDTTDVTQPLQAGCLTQIMENHDQTKAIVVIPPGIVIGELSIADTLLIRWLLEDYRIFGVLQNALQDNQTRIDLFLERIT